MSDLVISWLRGVVPGAWSALVTALLAWATASAPWLLQLLDALNIDLGSPAAVAFVMALVLAVWLAVWRRIEPHVPDWLSRIAMGSALTPAYQLGTVYPVAAYNTGDDVVLTDGSEVTIGSIIMYRSAEVASYTAHYDSGEEAVVRETDIARRVGRTE